MKGAAATVDGFLPVPGVNVFQGVYANEDGSIDAKYSASRLLGNISFVSSLASINGAISNSLTKSFGYSPNSVPLFDRLVFQQVWFGQLLSNTLGNSGALTWGLANTVLNAASLFETFNEAQNLRNSVKR